MFVPHTRLSFIGTWQQESQEIWETGIALVDVTTEEPIADLQGLVDGIADDAETWFAASDSLHPSSARMTTLKAANIEANGTYSGPPALHDYATPITGGGGSQAAPGFCCLAITTQSDNFRAPGKYGRMYPPNCSASIGIAPGGTEFKVSTTDALGIANSLGALFVGLIVLFARPVIASKVGSGSNTAITKLSCETVYDTQRSRKNEVVGVREYGTTFTG